MRIALGVEYEGTNYYGWQKQTYDKLPTVQACVEKALSNVADHTVDVICAGRTDAGVHATGQVIHFDTAANRSERTWILGTNTHLPPDISVRWAKIMPDNFHARFSATARRYQYLIYNSPVRSAIMRNKGTNFYFPLDAERMHLAAQHFIGEYDFTSFRAAGCQSKSPIRRIMHFSIERQGSWITCEVQANAFLHHMVRNMVGALLEVGSGKKEISWIKDVLAMRNRTLSAATAPAQGLYLVRVIYPEYFKL